jgi:DNA-binding transcriptional LysR family regulator
MDVHLRELRYFVAVAEQLHFGRAAESLFVSQPALSKQIRALESRLQAQLFERDRRSVRLTHAGDALLPHVRETLAAWERAKVELAAVATATDATLTVGMSTGLGRGLLPAVRARLSAAAPHARLQLRQVSWDDPTGGIAVGLADAAFVWLPLPADRFEWLTVAVESRLVLMPSFHPRAAEETLDFATLLDEPFLAPPPESRAAREYWLAIDARGGREPVIGAEIASTDETREALLAGLGICLVAAGNVELFAHDEIVARRVANVPPSELVLAWRRGDDRPLLRMLVDATRGSLGH